MEDRMSGDGLPRAANGTGKGERERDTHPPANIVHVLLESAREVERGLLETIG